jgi:hypothetical protein
MQYYVGLDVSVKETSVCIVDKAGKVVCAVLSLLREGKSLPKIRAIPRRHGWRRGMNRAIPGRHRFDPLPSKDPSGTHLDPQGHGSVRVIALTAN